MRLPARGHTGKLDDTSLRSVGVAGLRGETGLTFLQVWQVDPNPGGGAGLPQVV